METYNRPLTPPDSDRTAKVPDVNALQKKQEQTFPPVDTVNVNPLRTQEDRLRSPQAPPPPGYQQGSAFPFEKSHTGYTPPSSALSNKSEVIPRNDDAPPIPARKEAIEKPSIRPPPQVQGSSNENGPSQKDSYGSSQRNETTHRIETEVLSILQWKNPVRSGSILALIVGTILLTRSYSLLQIGAMALSLAIGINLIYVHFMLQGQRVLSQDSVAHPYRDVINEERSIDRSSVRHYTNVFIELSETLIRGLTRIVFIDNTKTSIKWLAISFVVWKVSAHVSAITLILLLTLSAFSFPRLYISNKDVVDAHIQRGHHLLQTGLNRAQVVAKEGIQDTYAKARSMAAQAGTTGTDAKNTMKNASVVEKQD